MQCYKDGNAALPQKLKRLGYNELYIQSPTIFLIEIHL